MNWYNTWRPHQALGGVTPEKRYRERQQMPAPQHVRFEVRERYPLRDARTRGSPGEVRRGTLRGIRVGGFDGYAELPVVERDVAACRVRS